MCGRKMTGGDRRMLLARIFTTIAADHVFDRRIVIT
jgi:hypothetical protein